MGGSPASAIRRVFSSKKATGSVGSERRTEVQSKFDAPKKTTAEQRRIRGRRSRRQRLQTGMLSGGTTLGTEYSARNPRQKTTLGT